MDIRILGALDVRENGAPVAPTAHKPRQVLALLALHADRPVTAGTLTEELWGPRPPAQRSGHRADVHHAPA